MKEKRISLYVVLGLAALYFVNIVVSFRLSADSLSSHYVDEEEDIVIAGNMNGDRKIYRDFFTHHQPLPYIISNIIQKVSLRSDISGLTIVHRVFISFWSIAWWGIFIFFFGPWFFVAAFIIEFTKIFFLGHFFFAESLVIFPLLWVSAEVFLKHNISPYFSGFCLSLIVFLFAPLWPLVAFYALMLARRTSPPKLILGALPVLALVLFYVPVFDYLYQTVFINLRYYIPDALSTSKYRSVGVFLGPLLALANPIVNPSLFVIKILALGLVYGLVLLLVSGKYKEALLALFILGMAGFHSSPARTVYYQEFHLLPWFAMLVLLFTLILSEKKQFSRMVVLVISLIAIAWLAWGRLKVQAEFSRYPIYLTEVGSFLEANGDKETELFVASADTFLYRLSGLPPANEFVYYHPWMYENPYVTKKIEESFATKPPTFLYYPPAQSPANQFLDKYVAICRDGKPTHLYLLKEVRGRIFPRGFFICSQ